MQATTVATTPFAVFDPMLASRLREGCDFHARLEAVPDYNMSLVADVPVRVTTSGRPVEADRFRCFFGIGRAERHRVQARILAVLVDCHRIAASGCISAPICLPELRDVVLADPEIGHCYELSGGVYVPKADSPEPPADDYPLAEFYKPADYGWTPDGYEVRAALKRYSESTHADR